MKKNSLFIALFLLLCLLPSLGMAVFGESEAAANELLADAPSLREPDGSLNTSALSDFSDWLGDRFFLRQELTTAWNAVNVRLLRSSPVEGVTLGRDGRLFYTDTLGDYTRSAPMSDRELWCAARAAYLMEEYAESRGARFVFTLSPNKNSLYGEYMPDLPRGEGESDAERFADAFTAMGGTYLDLFSLFRAQTEELYFRTDSHWNGKGAALAADAMLEALGKDGGWFDGGFTDAAPHRGDLYEMLYPAGTGTEPDYAPAGGFSYSYARPFRSADDLRIDTESGSGSGTLLCFRDSFGRSSFPYLAERFASARFSRQTAYDLTAVDALGADSVLIELVERNLDYLLVYDPVFPAPVRSSDLHYEMLNLSAQASGTGTLSGTLPTAADDDSPVYILCGGVCYETLPRPDGFAVTLPEGVSPEGAVLVYFSEGKCVGASLRF